MPCQTRLVLVPVNPSARPIWCEIQGSILTCPRMLGRPYLPIAEDEAPSLALCRQAEDSKLLQFVPSAERGPQ
jgi:hypothetical protein